MDIRTILLPVDFSEHSAKALDAATGLARSFGARLELLHCYPPSAAVVGHYGVVFPVDLERKVREGAIARLEEWVQKATAVGIDARGTVTAAPPVSGIAEHALETDADLIVMGTRGLSGLKHLLLGSVAERTIRAARCPVLTVHADRDRS